MQAEGSQIGAKEDTVLLLLGSLDEDLSQYGTDLTLSGAGSYESPSVRAGLTDARTIALRVTFTAAEASKVLAYHGDTTATGYTWAISTDPNGRLCGHQTSGQVWVTTDPVTAVDTTVAWSMRANPDTTGASDAMLSEFWIYDHTNGALIERRVVVHGAPTTDAAYNLSVGGLWTGGALSAAPTNAVANMRLGHVGLPVVESDEDWVAERAALVTGYEVPEEPIGAGAPVAGVGHYAGQANLGFIAAHARALRGRMMSPFVFETFDDGLEVVAALPSEWSLAAPSSATYKIDVTKLRWIRLPTPGQRARVRLHVKSTVLAGAAVPIGLRVYVFNRPQLGLGAILGGAPIPSFEHTFAEAVIEVDHTGTDGAWVDLGELGLPHIDEPIPCYQTTAHVAIAFAVDPAGESANDANAELVINALSLHPIIK